MRASRGEGRARPGLVARARVCGERRQEQFSDLLLENGQVRDFFSSLLIHLADCKGNIVLIRVIQILDRLHQGIDKFAASCVAVLFDDRLDFLITEKLQAVA